MKKLGSRWQAQYPLLFLHQLEELAKERIAAECGTRSKNDKLSLGSSEGNVDAAPVAQKVADLLLA